MFVFEQAERPKDTRPSGNNPYKYCAVLSFWKTEGDPDLAGITTEHPTTTIRGKISISLK